MPAIGICSALLNLIGEESVKEKLPPVIQRLIKWRAQNELSQRGASEVLKGHGLDVSLSALKQWEQGARVPMPLAAKALRDFLSQHPTIENPPRYRPGPK